MPFISSLNRPNNNNGTQVLDLPVADNQPIRPNFLKLVIYTFVASLLVSFFLYPVFTQYPMGLIRDDGYFYAQIAYNIATQHFSSFDGIHHTDGYHQLWAYLLAGISSLINLVTPDKKAHLIAFLTVNLAIVLSLIQLISKNVWNRVIAVLLLLLTSMLMEGHLAGFLLIGAVVLSSKERKSLLPFATCLFLLPIARIDATLIGIFLAAGFTWQKQSKLATTAILALVTGAATHFLLLKSIHGTWTTVSSQLKKESGLSLFDNMARNITFGGNKAFLPINPLLLTTLVLAACAAYLLFVNRKSENAKLNLSLFLGSGAFLSIHFAFNVLRPWYFAIPIAACLYLIFNQIEGSNATPKLLTKLISITVSTVVLLGTAVTAALLYKQRTEAANILAFYDQVRNIVPKNEPIYMVDSSGHPGYFLERPLINGDGLVNSHDYANLLRTNGLSTYFDQEDIRYFITSGSEPSLDFHGLNLNESNSRILITKRGNGAYRYTEFVLHEYTP